MQNSRAPEIDAQTAAAVADTPGGAALGHLMLGYQLFQEGHCAEALGELQAAIRMNPELSKAHFFKAVVLLTLADFRDARAALIDALALKNDEPVPWLFLGFIESESGNEAAALEATRRATEVDPHCAAAYFFHGTLLQKANRLDQSIEAYRQAIRCNPHLTIARYRLARALQLNGAEQEALQQVLAGLRINCYEPRGRMAAGDLLAGLGDLQYALEEYRIALSVDTNNPAPRAKLALTLARMGRHDEAERELRETLERNPKEVNCLLALGQLYLDKQQVPQALAFVEQALEIDAAYPPARALHAQALALGQSGKSVANGTTGRTGTTPLAAATGT